MKLALSADGDNLQAMIDPRFGRALYFLIVDTETDEVKAIKNPNVELEAGGAGERSAQLVITEGIGAVITTNISKGAFEAFKEAGIKIYSETAGVCSHAVTQFKNNDLGEATGPTEPGYLGR